MNKNLLAQPWEKSGISNTSYAYDGSNWLSTVTLSQSSGHRMSGSDDSVNEDDAETSRDSLNEKDTAASWNAGKGKAKTTTVQFTYDGDGVRTGKSVTSQSKTDATQYLWDINHGLPQVLTESGKKERPCTRMASAASPWQIPKRERCSTSTTALEACAA
jgi:hypothetical protein